MDDEGSGLCTSWSESYYHFRNYINDYSSDNIYFFYTGSDLYNLDLTRANRSFQYQNKICLQEQELSDEYIYKMTPTALHEMGHAIGAEDHYHEELGEDGAKYCKSAERCSGYYDYDSEQWVKCPYNDGTKARPRFCLMNAGIDEETIDANATNKSWCEECRQDILNYIY